MANNKKPRSRARRRFRSFLIFIEVVAMLLVVMGSYVWGKVSRINTLELDSSKLYINEEAAQRNLTGYINVALFGVDSRSGLLSDGTNSDTMIVASIDNNNKKVNMVSLYRDTYIDICNSYNSYTKANAAYAQGGPEGALSMLNKSMDLTLDKYITVDFGALIKVIDGLGGIDIEMTAEEAYWTDGYIAETALAAGMPIQGPEDQLPHQKGGTYHVNGIQATAFCRVRYTEGDDFKRTERQRYVLSVIFEKAKTMDMATLSDIADEVFPYVLTNMSLKEMISIGSAIISYDLGDSIGLPINKVTGYVGASGDCVIPTNWYEDVKYMHSVLFGDTSYNPSSVVQEMSNTMSGTSYTNEPTGDYSDPEYDSGYNSGYDPGYGSGTDSGSGSGGTSGSDSESGSGGSDGGTGDVTAPDPGTGTE